MFHYKLYLWFCLFASSSCQDQPVIKLNTGEVRGHYKHSYENRTFAAFEGIPYAKPPVGELRFAEPQPNEPWTGTLDAIKLHTCLQLQMVTHKLMGSEDCLYVNVYVPKEKLGANKNLDVIVNIHGGAFMLGSPELGGPEFLMDRDIVYVSLNYRLNVLGFLSTEDDVIPGNNGMKDQVFALKWVRDNIANFGGNPDSVTISGLSAGGASVHLHYFSPLSKGLFKGGIAQSGVAIVPWAVQRAPLQRARQISETVGCKHDTSKQIIECLREVPAEYIVGNMTKLEILPGFPLVLFGPTIENPSPSAFLTEHPHKLLSNGDVYDVPLVTSIVTEEGILALIILARSLNRVNDEWNHFGPYLLEYALSVPKDQQDAVSQKIREFYFQDKKISTETAPQLIKLFGERYFNLDMEKAARMQAKVAKSPVYAYVYGHKKTGGSDILRRMVGFDDSIGIGHGDDGQLIYNVRFSGIQVSPKHLVEGDEKIKNTVVQIFASFAKSGTPVVNGTEWKPVTFSGDFNYLFIKGPDDIRSVSVKEIGSTDFWESLAIPDYDRIKTENN